MRKNSGFTLVEVLIAMAMLGAAIAFSTYTTQQVSTAYSQNKQMSKAHEVASSLLEELLATFPSDAKLTDGDHTQLYNRETRKVAADGVYTAVWTVRNNQPIAKVIEIRLRVSWLEGTHQRSVHYVTFRRT